ncbi:hypothetical protein BDC45DRAFT_541568 [Circinella umbellata]|nr:hypothetical protein BDC45DRAFT_541568 [Circinella umbellata]
MVLCKAIPAELLITLNEAIKLIPSCCDDDEGTEIDSNRLVTRDDRSISYSVDAYISFDDNMRVMDDQELLTHVRTRDKYHYYQQSANDTRLKYSNSFVCHCSQDTDTHQKVSDDRRKRIRTRMKTYNCGGFIRGLIERRFKYVHVNIEHSTGNRAASLITDNRVDENMRNYIQQNCTRMDALRLLSRYTRTFSWCVGSNPTIPRFNIGEIAHLKININFAVINLFLSVRFLDGVVDQHLKMFRTCYMKEGSVIVKIIN